MARVTREKIALIVFTACLALISMGIGAYMVAGHSWNYAASRIDDAAGEMEGYRIVLFEGTAIPARTHVDAQGFLESEPISLSAACADYREKGATVLTVDTCNPARYAQPAIFERDGYRIGVVYLPDTTRPKDARESADYLVSHGCRAVVALAPDASAAASIPGIDIVVDLGSSRAISGGAGDAYRIQMPPVGSIGGIVISPSEVVSSRTITSA